MRYANTVTVETMLWICEHCPIAAGSITRYDLFNIGTFQTIENYRVYFDDDTEYALYLLRWS